MTSADIGNFIQIAVVIAAVAAAIVALVVSAKDRRNAQKIAEDDRASAARLAAEDRREALRQTHLMYELQALAKLLENLNRGGSSDPAETRKMGAEALTLIGALGPERLPHLWEERVGGDARLKAAYEDPEMPAYKKDALEAQLAVSSVLEEIRAALEA